MSVLERAWALVLAAWSALATPSSHRLPFLPLRTPPGLASSPGRGQEGQGQGPEAGEDEGGPLPAACTVPERLGNLPAFGTSCEDLPALPPLQGPPASFPNGRDGLPQIPWVPSKMLIPRLLPATQGPGWGGARNPQAVDKPRRENHPGGEEERKGAAGGGAGSPPTGIKCERGQNPPVNSERNKSHRMFYILIEAIIQY